MLKRTAIVALPALALFLGGCAHQHADLQDSINRAQGTADEAKAMASDAKATADKAAMAAAKAQQDAADAKAAAAKAQQDAADAKAAADAANEKADRMFKKTMSK